LKSLQNSADHQKLCHDFWRIYALPTVIWDDFNALSDSVK
jgi:hypothetical protein